MGVVVGLLAFGLVVDSPDQIVRGLWEILTTRDALLTDYFGIGGIGAGCVNAGMLTLGGANTFTGVATINSGVLDIRNASALTAASVPSCMTPARSIARSIHAVINSSSEMIPAKG